MKPDCFEKGDRVMVILGERQAELGKFAYYGESGLCWVEFIDGETLAYTEIQIKRFSEWPSTRLSLRGGSK